VPTLLFLFKPVIYLVAFVIAQRIFGEPGSLGRIKTWAATAGAGVLRTALGFVSYLLTGKFLELLGDAAEHLAGAYLPMIFALGFLWWLVCARALFDKPSWARLAMFAAAAELVSVGIDLWTIHDWKDVRFC
jgi:hypothetical protein